MGNQNSEVLLFDEAEQEKIEAVTERRKSVKKQDRERRKKLKKLKAKIAIGVLFCGSLIFAFGALNFVVKHAHEFENIRCAEAANISEEEKEEIITKVKQEKAEKSEEKEDWKLTLVNEDHPVSDDYETQLIMLSNGEQVDSRIYPQLQMMFDDMRSEGFYPMVASGYRSKETQQQLFDDKVTNCLVQGYSQEEAEDQAKTWVAAPGTSEHQLGLAVDINSKIDEALFDSETGITPIYQWLIDNSYRYGFVLRYPSGKESITGVNFEPWHYRYVGIENSKRMHESGLTLEEYIEQ